jgi:hypothetical protein
VKLWEQRFNGPENNNDFLRGMVLVNPGGVVPVAGNARIFVTGVSAEDAVTIGYSQPDVILPSPHPNITKEIESPAQKFRIIHNPSPAGTFTNIQFHLPSDGRVTIDIYDLTGRKVYTLVDGFRKAGTHISRFSTANLADGTYYYKFLVRSGGKEFRETKAMIIQR